MAGYEGTPLMAQSRKHSLLEIASSTAFGVAVSLIANKIILPPLMGTTIDFKTDAIITGAFTFVSVVRGYVFRRIFNHFTGD